MSRPPAAAHRSAQAVFLADHPLLVDLEQAVVWLRGQIDVEKRDDGLVALSVVDRKLFERAGGGVQHQLDPRRSAERRLVLDQDRYGLVARLDAQNLSVPGQIKMVGEQEFQRRLTDKIEI